MPSAAASFAAEMAMAHVPVLAQELIDVLGVRPDSVVVDCTFGAGGHAALVAAELGAKGVLVACDQDPVAAHYYRDLKHLPKGSRFIAGNFADVLARPGRRGLQGHSRLPGPGPEQHADRHSRAGLLVQLRRPAGHAHGSRRCRSRRPT